MSVTRRNAWIAIVAVAALTAIAAAPAQAARPLSAKELRQVARDVKLTNWDGAQLQADCLEGERSTRDRDWARVRMKTACGADWQEVPFLRRTGGRWKQRGAAGDTCLLGTAGARPRVLTELGCSVMWSPPTAALGICSGIAGTSAFSRRKVSCSVVRSTAKKWVKAQSKQPRLDRSVKQFDCHVNVSPSEGGLLLCASGAAYFGAPLESGKLWQGLAGDATPPEPTAPAPVGEVPCGEVIVTNAYGSTLGGPVVAEGIDCPAARAAIEYALLEPAPGGGNGPGQPAGWECARGSAGAADALICTHVASSGKAMLRSA